HFWRIRPSLVDLRPRDRWNIESVVSRDVSRLYAGCRNYSYGALSQVLAITGDTPSNARLPEIRTHINNREFVSVSMAVCRMGHISTACGSRSVEVCNSARHLFLIALFVWVDPIVHPLRWIR